MKISKSLKYTVFLFFAAMYLSGLIVWLLKTFFQIDLGMGLEARPQQIWALRVHGSLSFFICLILGYVFRAHVLPSWSTGKGVRSGSFLLLPIVLLLLTVPPMLYITIEDLKASVALVHAYTGLLMALPFVAHLVAKKYRSR